MRITSVFPPAPILLRQRHAHPVAELSCDRQGGIGRAAFQLADLFPIQSVLASQLILAHSTSFPEFLQAPPQTLADAFGEVVGVVVVRRDGHEDSSPEFIEHELLLSGTQWRARNGVPGGVDVLPCPALGDEYGYFHTFVLTRDAWKQGERRSGVVGEMTIDGLFDRWIIRACGLMQTGLRG
jgi:hypothetical protein